jgi:choline kinase/predicted SAM-dependent methyltransferase
LKAIILAAGEGSRLGEIAEGRPKCLIHIEDNTLLEIQINTLHSCGIDDVSVVRGYEAEKINVPGLKYYDSPDYASTNMLHSLFYAQKEMMGDILILYADILYEEQVIKRLLESSHDIVVGVMVNWKEAIRQRTTIALEELEMVYFDSENRIQKIGKSLTEEYETQGQFIGIVKCTHRGIDILKRNYERVKKLYYGKPFGQAVVFEKAWMTDIFQEMTELGVPLYCVIIERGWMEIDTPEDYERALTDTQFVRRLVKMKTDWDHRSKFYNLLEWTSRDELLNTIIEIAGDLRGKKVLDVGTGTGKVLIAFKKQQANANYYGIDVSQGMLDKIDPSYGFKLSIREMENLHGFQDEYFDMVTARMVFHHAKNLEMAINEIYRVLKPGGSFILCEGNPPNRYSISFYEDMFRFKEERITFLLDDLVNLLASKGFQKITSRTVILKNMSLNNWLENSGLPFRNIDIIRKMHYDCDVFVQKAYNMKFQNDDILMDWRFSVVSGTK